MRLSWIGSCWVGETSMPGSRSNRRQYQCRIAVASSQDKHRAFAVSGRSFYLCDTKAKLSAPQEKLLCPKQSGCLGWWDLRRSGSRFPKGVGFPCVLLTLGSLVINRDCCITRAGLAVGILPDD